MNKTNNMRSSSIRWQLLVTVSAAALLASTYDAGAVDNDSDRPLLWVELGGQLEGLSNAQEAFAPPFVASVTRPGLSSALDVQRPPAYAFAADGKISFQPENSDWVFSASIQYGRSQARRDRHHQTPNATVPVAPFTFFGYHFGNKYYYPSLRRKFTDGSTRQSERHDILDFQAGKDVGLGMFGSHGSSVLSAGVRIAQFSSKTNVTLSGVPDLQYPTKPISNIAGLIAFDNYHIHFHDYAAMENNQRDFRGAGPSVAWNASVPFAGDSEHGEIALDWGANAALLFGRQKARGHHRTAVQSYYKNYWRGGAGQGHFVNYTMLAQHGTQGYETGGATAHRTNAASFNRVRSVTVPNLGGFAGLSYRYANAKLSLGYRADFFFGAIDGGIDTRKSENRGFYGPFASISVGVGD